MEFFDVLDKRYSVRSFSSEKVDEADISKILESARTAPTAGNRQPVRILKIEGEELTAKADLTTGCRFGSPLMFLVCYDKDACWVRPMDGQDSGFTDASIVGSYMMLTAEAIGLSTLWVMFFDSAKARSEFSLPDNIIPASYIVCGHPSEKAAPTDRHTQRLTLGEMML